MDEEIKKLKQRKEALYKSIEATKEKKKAVREKAQELLNQVVSGKISKVEYDEKLAKSLNYRTSEQWVKYYDDYINYYNYQIKLCDRLIREEGSGGVKSRRVQILKIAIFILLITIFLSLILILQPIAKSSFKAIGEKISSLESIFAKAGIEKISAPEVPSSEILAEKKPTEPSLVFKDSSKKVEFSEETTHSQAVLGEPVEWKKKIDLKNPAEIKLNLPVSSSSIKIYEISGQEKKDITSGVSFNKKGKILGIFGKDKTLEVSDLKQALNYEVEYETPAPEISKETLDNWKERISIKNPSGISYENLLSYVKIPKILKSGQGIIKIYEIKKINGKETRNEIKFFSYDSDEDGYIDKLEWITPFLSSSQDSVFDFIIEISKAEHLDKNRVFISDIFPEVSRLDNNWSELIYNNEYVRVTFSQELNYSNDITLYARNTQNKRTLVEVYYPDSDEKITEFPVIDHEGYYKVLLNNLRGTNDVFDLKIKNLDGDSSAYLEFDYIVDPVTTIYQCICQYVPWQALLYHYTTSSDCNSYCNSIGVSCNFLGLPCGGFFGYSSPPPYQPPNTIPLYRCFKITLEDRGDTLYTLSSTCENAPGYQYKEFLGYIPNYDTSTCFWRQFNTLDGYHYYVPFDPGPGNSETHFCLFPSSCSDVCTQGQKRCNGNYVETCDYYGGSPCLNWGGGIFCTNGCSDGACLTTQVSDCGLLNLPNKYYYQTSNIIPDVSACINISAENVIYDCRGYSISNISFGGTAIYSSDSNTIIKNCNIKINFTGDSRGIFLYNSSNSTIYNNTITSTYGIYLSYSNASTIYSNSVYSNDTGIYLWRSTKANVSNNFLNSNDTGIYISFNPYSYFFNNSIINTGNYGIYLVSGFLNTFLNNRLINNSLYGFYLGSAPYNNNIINNSVSGSRYGFSTSGNVIGNFLVNNTAVNNTYGFYLSTSRNFTLLNNIANNNTYGLYLYISTINNTIFGGTFNYNNFGIYIYTMSNSQNNITNINTSYNLYGIYIRQSLNNWFSNIFSSNNDRYGVFILWGSNNSIFRDSSFYQNGYSDVNLSTMSNQGAWNTTFLNCSYNTESVDSNSQLIRKWYYRAYVDNTYGVGVDNATVSAFNATTFANQFNLTTDSNGWTNITTIIDYIKNGGTRSFYSLYKINATKKGVVDEHLFNASLGNNLSDIFWLDVSDSTNVDACRVLSKPNKVYSLILDIVNNELTGPCIRVGTQNITLDCQGHYILSDDAYAGVYSNQFNTTIKNCNISMNSSSGGYGIFLDSTNNAFIFNNTLNNQQFGLYLSYTNNSVIRNNTANNNLLYGIYLRSSNFSLLINNTANYNLNSGILIYNSFNNNITKNIINNNSQKGIYFLSGSNNIFSYNIILNHRGSSVGGFYYSLSSGFINNFLINNEFYNNFNGLYASGIYSVVNLTGGIFFNNSRGIYLLSSNNFVSNVKLINNSYGILSYYNNNYFMNIISEGDTYGIFISASSSNNSLVNASVKGSTTGVLISGFGFNNSAINITAKNCTTGVFFGSNYNSLVNGYFSENYNGLTIGSSNNTLMNINSVNNSQYGIFIYNSNNTFIRDSNFSLNSYYDVNVSGGSINNTFINCSYDTSKEFVDSYSQLIRKWYYRAYVKDVAGNFVNKTNVSAYNVSGANQFNLTTNGSGWTNITAIIDYINNGGTRSFYSLYKINATNGTLRDEHFFNASLGNNLSDVFILRLDSEIYDCRELNQPNTVYKMSNNIINPIITQGACINITAQNVTFDCSGYAIKSNYNILGIYSNQINTTVKNCNISVGSGGDNGAIDIVFQNADYSIIQNSTISGSSGWGICLYSNNSKLINNNVSTYGRGIDLANTKNNNLINNTVIGNTTSGGITIFDSSNITLLNNLGINYYSLGGSGIGLWNSKNITLIKNSGISEYGTGLFLFLSNYNIFINNTFVSNSSYGIRIESSNYNLLVNDTGTSNSRYGIYLSSSSNNTLTSNTGISNSSYGIYISSSSNNILINSSGTSNSGNGIYLSSSSNNTFISSTGTSNLWYGIGLSGSNNNTLLNNTGTSNSSWGIYLASSNNNTLINNTGTSNSFPGIELDSSSNNILTSNTGGTSNSSQSGIILYSANNNILTRNIGISNSRYGIYLYSSSNNTLTSNTGTSNSSYALYISSGSNNNVITNSNATGLSSGSYGIYIGGGSNDTLLKDCVNVKGISGDVSLTGNSINNTFINCSYRTIGTNESVASGSQLIRKWYYRAYTKDIYGNYVNKTNVSAFNATTFANQFNLTTNATGWTNITTIIDYINFGGTRSFYSPYKINATNGTLRDEHFFNASLGNNLSDVFILKIPDIFAPILNFTFPTPPNNSITNNNFVEINVSIAEENLNEFKFNWNGTNFTIYNDSLVLMYNFDSNSLVGDSSTSVTDLSNYNNNGNFYPGLIDDFEDGDYNGWAYGCGGDNGLSITFLGYLSNYALKIAGTGFACALTPYTYTVSAGQSISFACKGYGCYMCVHNGIACINTGVVSHGYVNDWTVYTTTVTSTQSGVDFHIYNDPSLGNTAYYDDITLGPIWDKNGRFGPGLHFDGVDDYVTLPASTKLGLNKTSVIFWIKAVTNGNGRSIIRVGNNAPYIYLNGLTPAVYWDGAKGLPASDTYIDWGTVIPSDTWTQIAFVTQEETNGNFSWWAYTNAQVIKSGTNAQLPSGLNTISYLAGAFKGTIDEVRIWNRALNSSEVYENYVSNLAKYNQTQWYFYVNQSKNATEGLDYRNYSYYAYAKDFSGNQNKTETRIIRIQKIPNENSESANEWRMFRKFLNHTAWDSQSFSVVPGLNVTRFSTKGDTSSPAIWNGFVYFEDSSGQVYQLNASNVSKKISNFTTQAEALAFIPSPAVANGYVYVGSYDKNIYQLNATNISQLIANFSTGATIASTPAVANGFVYVQSYDGYIYQLNASNISQKISEYNTGGGQSSPAVYNGYVYIGSNSNNVYQLNASLISQKISSFPTSGMVSSSPAVANGYVYVVDTSSQIYQLSAIDLSLMHSYTIGTASYSSPTVANGYVYVGEYSGYKVYQLDAYDVSHFINSFTTQSVVRSSPAYANGYIYIGSYVLYQLDALDISKVKGYFDRAGRESSPSVANGYIYVGGNDNQFYQINASNISKGNYPVPDVFFVSQPNATILSLGTKVSISFNYLVYSVGGTDSLPGGTSCTVQSGTNVNGAFNGTAGSTSNYKADAILCTRVGTPSITYQGTPNTPVSNYSCNIDMYYYYEPNPASWTINASMRDCSNSIQRASNITRTFQLQPLYGWDMIPNYVNWTNVQIGATNKIADNVLTINNTGNMDIGPAGQQLSINATNLTGKTDSSKGIPGDNFAANYGAGSTTPCAAGRLDLINSLYPPFPPAIIVDHKQSTQSLAARTDIGFCLETTGSITQQTYETQAGNTWMIRSP